MEKYIVKMSEVFEMPADIKIFIREYFIIIQVLL